MSDAVIAALIAGAASVGGAGLGAYFSNRRASALISYRLEQLEKKVDKHNNVIERTYALEERAAVQEEKLAAADHRIADLVSRGGK